MIKSECRTDLLKTLDVDATEKGGATQYKYLGRVYNGVVEVALVIEAAENGYYFFCFDFPVCRNDQFCASEDLHQLKGYPPGDIGLHEVNFSTTKDAYTFATFEFLRQYLMLILTKNRH